MDAAQMYNEIPAGGEGALRLPEVMRKTWGHFPTSPKGVFHSERTAGAKVKSL